PETVQLPNLESWKLQPGATSSDPSTLVIQCGEPFKGGTLQVRCLAPPGSGGRWTFPQVRLVSAFEAAEADAGRATASPPVAIVPHAENLVVRVDPDIQLTEWRPGDFHLTDGTFDPDGWQVLHLSAGLDAGSRGVRPSARLRGQASAYRVRQLAWWQIRPA